MSSNPLRYPSPASSPQQPSSLRHEYKYDREDEDKDRLKAQAPDETQARAEVHRPGKSTAVKQQRFASLLLRMTFNLKLFPRSLPTPQEPPKKSITDGSIPSAVSRQDLTFTAGTPIPCFDISPDRDRAVLAGREIFQVIEIKETGCIQVVNIHKAIKHSAAKSPSARGRTPAAERERLTIKDVKWAHGVFDQKIVTAAANGQIFIYDIGNGCKEWNHLHQHNRQVHTLGINPFESSLLLSGSQDATVRLWDLRDVSIAKEGQAVMSRVCFQGNSDAVRDIRWSPQAVHYYVIGTDSGTVQKWDIRKHNAPVLRVRAHEKACNAVDWHPSGRHILSAGSDKDLKIWDFSSSERRLKPQISFRAPQAVLSARWRPGCERSGRGEISNWENVQIATSFDKEDPQILFWDTQNPYVPSRAFNQYDVPPNSILWHSEETLWSVGDHGMFTQTNISTLPSRKRPHPPRALSAAFPDCSILHVMNDAPGEDTQGLDGEGPDIRPQRLESTSEEQLSLYGMISEGGVDHGSSELLKSAYIGPKSVARIIRIPGITIDVNQIEFLALNLAPLPPAADDQTSSNFHQEFRDIMKQNEEVAHQAGRPGLESHFAIFAHCGKLELLKRAEYNRSLRLGHSEASATFLPCDFRPITLHGLERPIIPVADLCRQICVHDSTNRDLELQVYVYFNIMPWFPTSKVIFDDEVLRYQTVWAYHDRLIRLGLSIPANALRKEWHRICTNADQTLGHGDVFVARFRCKKCKKPLRGNASCERCHTPRFTCGWCRRSVNGLFTFCQRCGHGCHLQCRKKQSTAFSNQNYLACLWVNCGCVCVPAGQKEPDHVMEVPKKTSKRTLLPK